MCFCHHKEKKLRSSIFGYIYFSTEPAQYSKQCSYPSNQGCQQNEKQYVMVSNPYDYSQTDTSVNILSSFGSSSIFSVYANDVFKNSQIKETKERTHIQSTLSYIFVCHWTSGSGSAFDRESSMTFYFGINRGCLLIVKTEMITVLLLLLQ